MSYAMMKAIRAAIDALPALERQHLFAGYSRAGVRIGVPDPESLVRRGEAARRLCCSPRHIDHLVHQGLLRKMKLPGRSRSCGIVASDIQRLIEKYVWSGSQLRR